VAVDTVGVRDLLREVKALREDLARKQKGWPMSDLVASWLRTVVPGLWSDLLGSALAWLVVHAPWALDRLELLNIVPTSERLTAGVVLLVLAASYWLWRKAEPHIPDWLTRLVLGSSKAPTYPP
jgi:hypothetical protein